MEEFLNVIKELNYKEIWLKNIKSNNLINYFGIIDKETRTYLELYYVFFNNNDCSILDSNDKFILNYLNKKINDLLNESENSLLNPSEIKFLSMLLGRLILYNKEVSNEQLISYINNCYLNNKTTPLSSDLLILLKHSFNYLNCFNNSNIYLKLKNNNFMKEDLGRFKLNKEKLKEELFITNEYYNTFIEKYDNIPLEDFSYILTLQTTILLHEFRHYMQFRLMFRDSLTSKEDRLKKELEIISSNDLFYNIYNESFMLEIDAYKYAIDNLDYIIKDFILDDYYENTKASVISKCNNCINNKDITELIEDEYKNIKKRTRT